MTQVTHGCTYLKHWNSSDTPEVSDSHPLPSRLPPLLGFNHGHRAHGGDLMVHVCVWRFLGCIRNFTRCVSFMWCGLCVSVCTDLPSSFELPLAHFLLMGVQCVSDGRLIGTMLPSTSLNLNMPSQDTCGSVVPGWSLRHQIFGC